MKQWTKEDRYRHAVVDVAMSLHMERTGSGANYHSQDELEVLASWLNWRIGDGWIGGLSGPGFGAFDDAVRCMARAAVASWLKP